VDATVGLAQKCDLCGGATRCASVCPAGAIVVLGGPDETDAER